jgi:hypothetical protein
MAEDTTVTLKAPLVRMIEFVSKELTAADSDHPNLYTFPMSVEQLLVLGLRQTQVWIARNAAEPEITKAKISESNTEFNVILGDEATEGHNCQVEVISGQGKFVN